MGIQNISSSFFLLRAILWTVAVATSHSQIFSEEQVEFFQREGYLKVSGLLHKSLIHDLTAAAAHTIQTSPRFPFFYSVSQSGLIFGSSATDKANRQHNRMTSSVTTQAFRQAALYSQFPQAVAELMRLDPAKHNLRVLRDVFLAKSVEDPECCDWHVDDLGFWPESFLSAEGMDGVNVWIALDDMPASFQGSMAVAPRSHNATCRHRAYSALGQNRSQDGGRTKEDVIRKLHAQRQESLSAKENDVDEQQHRKSKYPTCDMRLVDPEITEILDGSQLVLDFKRGDVIFATRLLFHRTMPVTAAGVEYYRQQGIEHLSRYSIRYVPGTARLPQGWSVEWSIVEDNTNAGRSLDGVVANGNKMFYPQVWPSLEKALQPRLKVMENSVPSLSQRAQEEYLVTIFGATP